MEHVWAKIPQFYRRLVGWAGATEPPAHDNRRLVGWAGATEPPAHDKSMRM